VASTEKRTQIYLTEEQHRAACDLAHRKGVSLASVVRDALALYVSNDKAQSEAEWEDDPALGLLGKLELPPLPDGVDLDDAIDQTVYQEGTEPWSSPTALDSSQPLTRAAPATRKRHKRGRRSPGQKKSSSPRGSSSRKR
jgi:hypothetical protein